MMREEIVKEIEWRYKFIYENIEYIMGPFKDFFNKGKSRDYIISKRIPYELLNLVQKFLLEDGRSEFSEFVKYVERRKHDQDYVEMINDMRFNDQDRERMIWELFNSICNLIAIQERSSKIKIKKLKTIDEYYKILNYENKEKSIPHGSKLIAIYVKNEHKNLGNIFFNIKNDNYLPVGGFIKYVSDKKNYDSDSLGILTEKEKQQIYLTFHEELAWDIRVKCEVDKNTMYKPKKKHLLRQDINPPCGEEFYINEWRIFINPNDTCYDYYYVCPNCGYVVNIPHDLLPDGVRNRIEERCLNDQHNFSSMLLSAELRSMDYHDDVLVKKRKK